MAIGGEVIDNIYLNMRRFGIHVRYQEEYRTDPKVIENLLVHAENGALVPLKQVAQVKEVIGPIQINREKNRRRWVISANVRETWEALSVILKKASPLMLSCRRNITSNMAVSSRTSKEP